MILPILCGILGITALTQWLFSHMFTLIYAAFPVVIVLNILCVYFAPWHTEDLAVWNLRTKLWLIPIYLFVAFFGIGVPLAIPFLVVFDVLLLLASSGYGLRALVLARKESRIGKYLFLSLFVLHFFFVADIAAALVLRRKLK